MINRIGIVQGRLTKSPKNRLQHFPKKWEKEFMIARKLNFNFIEFFSERKINKDNPIWSEKKISEYKLLAKKNNLHILNFCDDYIISNKITNNKTIKYLENLIEKIKILGIKNLILPFYGKSNLTDENYKNYCKVLKKFLIKNKNLNFLIEANISPMTFERMIKILKIRNIFFLFDTGNRINLKRDIYSDLKSFLKFTMHIHLKDKNKEGKNVKLNTGLVNFRKIFYILKKDKYKKGFTFETTRGSNPIKMAKFNIDFLKKNFK